MKKKEIIKELLRFGLSCVLLFMMVILLILHLKQREYVASVFCIGAIYCAVLVVLNKEES